MRTLLAPAITALVLALPLAAHAFDPQAGPPKPGKKCAVAAEGVAADADAGAHGALAIAAVLGAAGALRRRAR
jgi:hypothetical protein